MSELINTHDNRATIRWKLLTGASAMALAAYMSTVAVAKAEDASQPLLWLELGGQWERQTGQGHTYAPPFIINNPGSPAFTPISPLHYERPPLYSQGFDGALTFQPKDSDWQFSASIRYGRASSRRSVIPGQKTGQRVHYTGLPGLKFSGGHWNVTKPPVSGYKTITGDVFAPIQADNGQKHTIIDFSAGKDVGLGFWGPDASGTISAGVRFAQFTSNTSAIMHARPDFIITYQNLGAFPHNVAHVYPSLPFIFAIGPHFHTYVNHFQAQREFKGVGPSISWKASMPIAGNPDDQTLTIDWGINAALLFGRQHARGSHQTSGHYYKSNNVHGIKSQYTNPVQTFDRSKRVTIPNVGGMIGMSLKISDFKMSIGYRGDFFFGAMDTGNDTRKTGRTGFYGPFASVSFGLGD